MPLKVSLLFTGHMTDLPDRAEPRFPQSLAAAAASEIGDRVQRRQRSSPASELVGFASGARGGDILFHEACRDCGIRTTIVLPFSPERFVETSVAGVPGADWVQRFWALWNDEARCFHKEAMGLPEADEAYAACNDRLLALAEAHGQLHLIALWDGKGGDGPGGTADLVRRAAGLGDAPDIGTPSRLGDAAR
jgi:hypothetical protein